MQTINRQALAERIHANAVAKGFWPTTEDGTYKYSPEHYAMLVITELSEAVEADRKGRKADAKRYDGLLTHAHKLQGDIGAIYKELKAQSDKEKRPLWEIAFEYYIKDSVEDELADAYIRLLDLSKGYGVNIENRFKSNVDLKEEPLSNRIFLIVGCVFGGYYSQALDRIEHLADDLGIDLLWHIEEKMRYNESRPARHGKEY